MFLTYLRYNKTICTFLDGIFFRKSIAHLFLHLDRPNVFLKFLFHFYKRHNLTKKLFMSFHLQIN